MPIKHGWELWQGDPLSPLLFVLATNPLHHILRKGTEQRNILSLRGRAPTVRTSPFADDNAIFFVPNKDDINFGNFTSLVTNCTKCEVAPIRCEDIHLEDVLQAFPTT